MILYTGQLDTEVDMTALCRQKADAMLTVKDEECVACNLCVDVCPVGCIDMKTLPVGSMDPRTGRPVAPYGNWTTHPNNPMASAAE